MTDQRPSPSFAGEIIRYLCHSKRWWLTPIVLALLFLAAVALLSGLAPALPFIYTLF